MDRYPYRRRPVQHNDRRQQREVGQPRLPLALLLLILLPGAARPATGGGEAHFDPGFLHKLSQPVDLTLFERPSPLPPGHYHLDLRVNGRPYGQGEITVKRTAAASTICVEKALLGMLPVKPQGINSAALRQLDDEEQCVTLPQLIPQSRIRADLSRLQLHISLPQALLQHSARDSISPQLWDDGVNALLAGYDSNYYDSRQGGTHYRSFYSGNELALNLGGFHFAHRGTLSWQPERGSDYNSLFNALQHDVTALNARLTLGDADTSGYLFDSFSWRGVSLASDESMLPDSRRGYAPVIQGMAQSNAHVSIRQGNTLLLETSVPPGPFQIDDLYPTGYGGDIEVTVREADGRESRFSVPYASLPQLVRPGNGLFSVTAGTLRNLNQPGSPKVIQGTLQYGVSNLLTGYGGLLTSEGYRSLLAGGALGTSFGSISLDTTTAQTRTGGRLRQGQRYRLAYSKVLINSQTTLSASVSQLSSPDYRDLSDAVQWIYQQKHPEYPGFGQLRQPRSRMSLTLSQRLPQTWGQLNVALLTQRHWSNDGQDNQLQAGYSNAFGSLAWSLSASRVRSRGGEEMLFALRIALPLGNTAHSPSLNMNLSRSNQGSGSQLGLSGSLDEQLLDYDLGLNRDEQQNSSASLATSWHLPATTLDSSISLGGHSRAWSAGLGGGVALVRDGLIFSPWYSDTMALVSAPGAAGAGISGYPGIKLDGSGRALVPWLMPYRRNEIAIDPLGLPQDVALRITSQKTVPRAGALVRMNFATRLGQPVLIHVTRPDGQGLPFGAQVSNTHGDPLGRVTQGNTIYVQLPPGLTHMRVTSGEQPLCQIALQLPVAIAKPGGIRQLNAVCLPMTARSLPNPNEKP
ncbi:fimbria/pilus outer membrane usher protein [Erwinia sp. B116]|uniref:fimbria/pilus outer membrane usher protein n=1 Tax=Erwinia sp. B116 TaxID=1561024 RepID=UPI000C78487B|nr:fimbria/pilus outer membrane usher protein [Erwinia sp. B116]